VPALATLYDSDIEVVVVVTNPDRPQGRGRKTRPSPVKAAALERGIPVIHKAAEVLEYTPDMGVVVAFGQLIKKELLDQLAFCNIHFSLLPKWRGAAPVEHAILAGDGHTGVTIMALEEALDTGPIFSSTATAIGSDETAAELTWRLAHLGADLLLQTFHEGFGVPQPQQGEPTWAHKLNPEDRNLLWERPSYELARIVRLGKAWTTLNSKRLVVHRALAHSNFQQDLRPGEFGLIQSRPIDLGISMQPAVIAGAGGNSVLELLEVQPEGRKTMLAKEWYRGLRLTGRELLGQQGQQLK